MILAGKADVKSAIGMLIQTPEHHICLIVLPEAETLHTVGTYENSVVPGSYK